MSTPFDMAGIIGEELSTPFDMVSVSAMPEWGLPFPSSAAYVVLTAPTVVGETLLRSTRRRSSRLDRRITLTPFESRTVATVLTGTTFLVSAPLSLPHQSGSFRDHHPGGACGRGRDECDGQLDRHADVRRRPHHRDETLTVAGDIGHDIHGGLTVARRLIAPVTGSPL